MDGMQYPLVREDAKRVKVEISQSSASIWFPSRYEAIRWILKKQRERTIDAWFADKAKSLICACGSVPFFANDDQIVEGLVKIAQELRN